ncbi:MAG: Fur family transcriptional regulator [Pseudomonadota bacterium]
MNKHENLTGDLTKNQSLVMNALSGSKTPLSAYTILDELREYGFRAPLQVYRALDKLVEFGLVHRLESLNAFVACQHPSCEGKKRESVLFAICEKCGNVQEMVSERLIEAVRSNAEDIGFSLEASVIELRGVCQTCKEA